ncbi:uncharacterized protein LOC106664451 [Cimex lectularius]|uniref:Uncharacterized protein n=1 Tax=Cimex lectularius TaxID=79782 RepID=A0A8I6RP23_CIMLE|nr:uncharacterized protein LOC106664451 [Cimex lectularius]
MDSAKVAFVLLGLIALCIGDASYSQEVTGNSLGSSYSAPYPVATQVAHAPAGHGFNNPSYTKWEHEGDAFSVQSGFEGYLVPSEPPFSFSDFLKTAGVLSILPPLSKLGLKLGWKLGLWTLGFLSLFLVGSLVTTAVCAFTPICTISFLGHGFSRESVRSFITEDRLNTATKFVFDAINKYREMNKKTPVKQESRK